MKLPELDTLPAIAGTDPVEFDTSSWPTQDEIDAMIESERKAARQRAELAQVEAELRDVLAAVEVAAEPITGALPVIVPLTKADAHRGAVEAVLVLACDRLREISRSRRTSELADVVALLEAVLTP